MEDVVYIELEKKIKKFIDQNNWRWNSKGGGILKNFLRKYTINVYKDKLVKNSDIVEEVIKNKVPTMIDF